MLALLFALAQSHRPTLMVHYMPWFQAKPNHTSWGWHWTMNKVDPDRLVNGQRKAATHYHPLIGLYDSDDEAVLECQVQLMKLAGIDGAFVDWYGNVDTYDYLPNHIASQHFIRIAKRAGLKFGIVYEDRTVPELIKHGKSTAESAIADGNRLMKWVDTNWFSSRDYLRLENKPVFLVFGPEYYKNEAWNSLF